MPGYLRHSELFSFGPRWDNIVSESKVAATADGDERLLELRLAEAFRDDLNRHPLHPSVLDSATAAARDLSLDGTFVPFHYGSLVAYAELPAHCYSHVVRRDAGPGLVVADITVYGTGGRVLAKAEEFTMIRAERSDFLAPVPRERGGSGDLPAGSGIEPADGVRLFLALLGAGGPPQVAVRPVVDGRHVPLAGPVLAPPPAVRTVPVVTPTAPQAAPAPTPSVPTATVGSVRDRLAALWSDVLGIRSIAADDDFFELGGNSLVAVELISRVRDSFGVSTSIIAVFENSSLDTLAAALVEQGAH